MALKCASPVGPPTDTSAGCTGTLAFLSASADGPHLRLKCPECDLARESVRTPSWGACNLVARCQQTITMSPLRPSLAALRSRLSSSSSLGSTRVEAAVACSPSAGSSINSRSLSSTRARRSSTLVNLSLLFGGATLGLGYATIFPSPLSRLLNPPIAPPSPVQHSPEGLAHTQDIEAQLQSLDQVKALRAEQEPSQSAPTSLTPESQLLRQPRWKESRPYLKYPEERRTHHLTAGLLKGPGKLAVAPLAFSTQDDKETIIFIHLGRSLCGHECVVVFLDPV